MEYTKGEWQIEGDFITNGAHCIATMNGIGNKVESDAHLIAAAPAMYEALKGMMAVFNRGLPSGSVGESVCKEGIKALAKAEVK